MGNLFDVVFCCVQMLAKNVEPPPAAFNSLIVAAQRAKQPDLVARSFQEMVNAGVTPSRETYETTLSAVSAGGMADAALEVSIFIYLFVWAIKLTSCFVYRCLDACAATGSSRVRARTTPSWRRAPPRRSRGPSRRSRFTTPWQPTARSRPTSARFRC